ncbi:hypothetical protein NPIL_344921 [Nephila pilipes]|uniref:Uncharacterized protein n=1 Tax=Nephila pilipes TaxID=299642 RepID=A0A8X6TI01_NEPPI|nr:hypothetical protein NPIL_344921 [Nephila pilipes]
MILPSSVGWDMCPNSAFKRYCVKAESIFWYGGEVISCVAYISAFLALEYRGFLSRNEELFGFLSLDRLRVVSEKEGKPPVVDSPTWDVWFGMALRGEIMFVEDTFP